MAGRRPTSIRISTWRCGRKSGRSRSSARGSRRSPIATTSSLSPSLEWDGRNPTREQGEWLLALIDEAAKLPSPQEFDQPRIFRRDDGSVVATCRGLHDAIDQLKRLGRPFLELGRQGGAAVVRCADVAAVRPRAALHEGDRRNAERPHEGARDPQIGCSSSSATRSTRSPIRCSRPTSTADKWVNRMILGDSLVVMNSLLQYEGLGGQVQMIYIDPPYGVKFGVELPAVRPQARRHAQR